MAYKELHNVVFCGDKDCRKVYRFDNSDGSDGIRSGDIRSDAALRERLELAEKATQGPWYHTLAAIVGTKKSPKDNDATCICFTEWGCSGDSQANAAHIAASSPDVVREDIEEILRLRGENKLLNSMVMSFAGKAVHETVGGWWST